MLAGMMKATFDIASARAPSSGKRIWRRRTNDGQCKVFPAPAAGRRPRRRRSRRRGFAGKLRWRTGGYGTKAALVGGRQVSLGRQNLFGQRDLHEKPCPGSVIDGIPIYESARLGWMFEWDIDDGRCTELTSKTDCKRPEAAQRIDGVLDTLLEVSSEGAQVLFGESFPCVGGTQGVTLCAPDATEAPGTYVFLMAQFGNEIPLAGDRIFQYAFVFETDGDESTDYVPHPSFAGDFFAGTDRWYEALYDPNQGWKLLVREVSPALAEVSSGARMVVLGRQLAIFVPADEIDPTLATFRVTAFSHTGDYGFTGGPWSGDYYPPLEYPLLPIAQVVFDL